MIVWGGMACESWQAYALFRDAAETGEHCAHVAAWHRCTFGERRAWEQKAKRDAAMLGLIDAE